MRDALVIVMGTLYGPPPTRNGVAGGVTSTCAWPIPAVGGCTSAGVGLGAAGLGVVAGAGTAGGGTAAALGGGGGGWGSGGAGGPANPAPGRVAGGTRTAGGG